MLNISFAFSISFGTWKQKKPSDDLHGAGPVGTRRQPPTRCLQRKNHVPSDQPKPEKAGPPLRTPAEQREVRTPLAQVDSSFAQLSPETQEMQRRLRQASRTPERARGAEEGIRRDRQSLRVLEVAHAKQRRRGRTGVRAFVSTTTGSEGVDGVDGWTLVSQSTTAVSGNVIVPNTLPASSPTKAGMHTLSLPGHNVRHLDLEEHRESPSDHGATTFSNDVAHTHKIDPFASPSTQDATEKENAMRESLRKYRQQQVESLHELFASVRAKDEAVGRSQGPEFAMGVPAGGATAALELMRVVSGGREKATGRQLDHEGDVPLLLAGGVALQAVTGTENDESGGGDGIVVQVETAADAEREDWLVI
ncbi:hypothetical protein B0A55_12289 [Friedmanniomyces simplex]|uniref:Uncharacterized protein n=1 Tax=Friedmanniomyces simplex TaxID=329884 RepID=A0A4U0W3F5_9PEZI|nr:hypothetical protein B0A55_12289 [Friedmanniomyces simplex]